MPKKWRNNWSAASLTEEEKNNRDHMLLTLGNLTLITSKLNTSISDSNWEKKKRGTNTHGGLIKYAQSLDTFSKYMDKDKWNESVISERGEELCRYALKEVWNIESL
jgi:hypothetical protein